MQQDGMGTLIKIGANAIAEMTSIGAVNPTMDTKETTNYNSAGWREFRPGLKDGGEVTLEGTFAPEDTNGQKAIIDAFTNKTKLSIAIILPTEFGFEEDFNAYVTGYSIDPPMDDSVKFSATLKITGPVTPAYVASAGLSALALTGTGGTISPVFASGTYYYSFGGLTAASLTVTATAASHTLQLYIDNVYSADLTSGAASAAIAMAIGSKKLTILARESGKTTKVYEIIVIKTA